MPSPAWQGRSQQKTLICLPSTMIKPSPAEISLGRLPRIESYFSRCANVAGLVKSFTATKSMFLIAHCSAKYVTANPAKAVDANLHCHVSILLHALLLKAGLKKSWRSAAGEVPQFRCGIALYRPNWQFHQTHDRNILVNGNQIARCPIWRRAVSHSETPLR